MTRSPRLAAVLAALLLPGFALAFAEVTVIEDQRSKARTNKRLSK